MTKEEPMRTQHNLDEMLERHVERFGDDPPGTRTNGTHDVPTGMVNPDEPDPLVRRAKILVHLSPTPRNSWPLHARQWNDADRAERREWVRKLYGDDGLAVKRVADLLGDGVSAATVQDDVHFLGIQRGHKLGKENTRSLAMAERREKVAALHAQGYNGPEIAEKTGYAANTVTNDLREMGLRNMTLDRKVDRQLSQIVARAVEQMSAMGQLVLNQEGLGTLAVDEATAQDWERQCKIVARAIGRVRRAMKGES